jgi:hypothetical protein
MARYVPRIVPSGERLLPEVTFAQRVGQGAATRVAVPMVPRQTTLDAVPRAGSATRRPLTRFAGAYRFALPVEDSAPTSIDFVVPSAGYMAFSENEDKLVC